MAKDHILALEQFIRENHINPYTVLGVPADADQDLIRKAYKRKAKLLHPDKNKSSESDVEFVILSACMEYTIALIEENDVLRKYRGNERVEPREEDFAIPSGGGGVDHSLFTGPERQNLMADDFDVHGLTEKLKERPQTVEEVRKGNEDIFNVFQNQKKFDANKFNALFESLQEKHGVQSGAMIEMNQGGPVAFDLMSGGSGMMGNSCSALSTTGIATYRGLMFNDRNTRDYSIGSSATDKKIIDRSAMANPKQVLEEILSEHDIDELVKKREKDMKKMSKKQVEELMAERMKEKFEPARGMSFAEAQELFEKEQMKQVRREMEGHREIFDKYGKIYGNEFIEYAKSGQLADSSTALFVDPTQSLITPGGENGDHPSGLDPKEVALKWGIPTGRRRA